MSLENLTPASGSTKSAGKRLGRGQASGKGGTAARGHNGQKSRSGYSRKIGFEGGQMPLQRRVPKFGFKNINRKEYRAINIDTVQDLLTDKKIAKELTIELLVQLRLAHSNDIVKILGRGELTSKVDVKVNAFTRYGTWKRSKT